MTHAKPADYDHLMRHARTRFPNASVTISYTDDERIYIDVDADRYAFDIGSDDDEYLFVGRAGTFAIPLMDWE
ncbi:MAG: hypothetical protein ACTS1Z_15075 [Parasphingopyxis sp.]|uniref:hypothetical protein n=1 Tax=Parasphingopyxis sp. TaxID=1920299 RepID=UPI003FA0DC05